MTDIVTPPDIDTLPPGPVRGQAGFSDATALFLEALPDWGDQVEASGQATATNAQVALERATDIAGVAQVAMYPAGFAATSTSVLTLDAGTKLVRLDGVDAENPPLFAQDELVVLIYRPNPTIKLFGSLVLTDGVDDLQVQVDEDGVVGSGGPFANWLVVAGEFFGTGATAAQEWAGESAGVSSTPKSRADANAKQALAYASTITPNLKEGWHRGLSASASFTMGAPTNCKPGDILLVDILNTAGSIVLAVNAAWDRGGAFLGVLDPASGARNKFIGFIDEVDGSGVMTRGTYNVIRGLG